MQDKVPFEYAIIRLLPRVEREEFINIGAILFCKRKDFIGMRFHLDSARLRLFSHCIDIKTIKEYLAAWEMVCKGKPAGGVVGTLDTASRYRWLTASRSTIIQSSDTHPGMCQNPMQELDRIFRMFVL